MPFEPPDALGWMWSRFSSCGSRGLPHIWQTGPSRSSSRDLLLRFALGVMFAMQAAYHKTFQSWATGGARACRRLGPTCDGPARWLTVGGRSHIVPTDRDDPEPVRQTKRTIMRLAEMHQLIESSLPILPASPIKSLPTNGGLHEYTPELRQQIRSVCESLSRIDYLRSDANEVIRDEVIASLGAAVLAPTAQMHATQNKIAALRNKANAADQIITQIIQESGRKPEKTSPELEVRIELGPISNIQEFDKRVHSLSIALDKPTRVIIGEGLTFGGLDIGSNWLLALAPDSNAMKFIMTLIGLGWYFFNKRLEHKQLADRLQALSITNAQLQAIEQQFERTITAETDLLLKNLGKKHRKRKVDEEEKEEDAGDIALLRGAVDRLQLLFSQGVEIRNKLQLPPELKIDSVKVPELIKASAEARKLLAPVTSAAALESEEDATDTKED